TTTTYSATALVAVIASRDSIEIDRSIVGIAENQPLAAFPEIALSDEVLRNAMMQLSMDKTTSISAFREKLESESGSDRSLIILTAKSDTPEKAAQIANIWAETFIDIANRLYVGQNEEQVLFFEEQLTKAEETLFDAELSLSEFQAVNQTQIITNTLTVYEQQYTNLLLRQIKTDQLLENAIALREQMQEQSSAVNVSYADQLTFLQLQLQSFNDESPSPVWLQLNTQENLTTENRGAHIEIIDGLIHTLEEKTLQADANLIELEPKILVLQQEGQIALAELTRLKNNLDIAQRTYNALAYQVSEERIIAQDTGSGFQLASRAVIPQESVNSSQLFSAVSGGFMGLLLATIGILFNDWWRRST
ncbi:hypothetical protein, partial [Nitrosomonas sp.]|uniref:hypothetical protein n=1 Tax=Nitrosomonas sp. TaxID=42353 RepID=UPI001D44AEF6